MPTTSIYYTDITNAQGRRYRITFTPPGSTVLTPTLPPAFGDDPALGSNFVKVPAGAITLGSANPTGGGEFLSSTDAKFTNSLPWGLAETTTYKLTVNFAHLQSSADLRDLASYLISYRATLANVINDNVPSDSYGFGARSIAAPVVVTITHDGGNAALAVGSFAVRFQGIPRVQPGRKGTITPGVGVVVEYELYHIARAVLETVTMQDVCGQTFHTTYGSGATASPKSGSDGGGFVRVYDMTWKSGSDVYSWFHEPKDQRVRLYHRAHLMRSAQRCATAAYCAMTRQTPSYTTWQFRFRGHAEDGTDYHATPWDHWTYHKQDHTLAANTVTNERGATLSARTDVHFIGTIALDDTPTTYYGGLLHDHETDASLQSFGTLWDFLAEACTDGGCKGVVRQTSTTGCDVWFLRLDESSSGSTTTATLADLRGAANPTGMPDPITFDAGGVAVCGAKIAPRQVFTNEPPDFVTNDATETDGPMTLRSIFDTLPSLGDGPVTWSPGDNGDYDCALFQKRTRWPMWKLYYVDTLAIFGGSLENAYRVHDSVIIHDGTAAQDVGSVASITLPTPASLPFPAYEGDTTWWRPATEAISARLRSGGSIGALANLVVTRYGLSVDPVTYTMTVADTLCDPLKLGERFSFGSNAGYFIDTGETTLDGLSTDCVLVAVKVDDTTNLADVTFLAIP